MSPRAVVIVDYDADWPRRAAALIAALEPALGPTARRIDHIGSTSIPGMAAKNVLDLQVSVDDLERAGAAFDAPLRALGFERMRYEQDHVPAGRDDDPARWAKRLWARRGTTDNRSASEDRSTSEDDVNLHVRVVGAPNERLALLFRDWLRAHPDAVPAYAAFKRALGGVVADTGVYSDVKDPVVDLVVTVAETWARHVSWAP